MWSFRLLTKSAFVGLALGLIAAAQEMPWRYAVKPGDTRATVIQTYGEPKSAVQTGQREVLLYPEGRVILQDGKLVELHFAQAEPHFVYAQDRAVKTPTPAPIAAPTTPPLPSGAAPASTPPPGLSPPDAFAPPPPIMIGGVALLLGVLLWLKFRRARSLAVAPLAVSPAAAPLAPRETAPFFFPAPAPAPLPFLAAKPPAELTLDLLQQLDWKRFDELVAASFRTDDVRAELAKPGEDGDVDVYLFRGGESLPSTYVRCKSWHDGLVGAKPVRELFGVMAAGGVSEGWFVATGDFAPEAREYAAGRNLHLLTGGQFVERINALPSGLLAKLLAAAFHGDWSTPTCPRCGMKMVLQMETQPYWRCSSYPRCRASYAVRAEG
jgi:hypothetical protein